MDAYDRAYMQRLNVLGSGRTDHELVVNEDGMAVYQLPEPTNPQPTLEDPRMNPFAMPADAPEEGMGPVEYAKNLGATAGGVLAGAGATALGSPFDIAGIIKGGIDAMGAEEGEGFATFLETLADYSETFGSEFFLNQIDQRLEQLPIDDELKETWRGASQYVGEMSGFPLGLKTMASGIRRYIRGAGERVAEREGGAVLRSGMDPREPIDNAIVGAQNMMRRADSEEPEAGPLSPEMTNPVTPAIEARTSEPTIIPESGSRVKNEDVGRYLVERTINTHGRKLDPINNPEDLDLIIQEGAAEAAYQLDQPISGVNWYNDDVASAFEQTAQVIPQLAEDEGLRVVMTAMAAATSPGTRAAQNWKNAAAVMEEWLQTGQISGRNPANGKYFGGTRGPIIEKQLQLLEHLLNTRGVQGTADFLLSEHSVKDLTAVRQESGLYSAGNKVPGKAGDQKLGAFLFGEKVGPFMLNLNGLAESTVDVWNARSYNRLTGQLFDTPDNSMVGGPRNETERDIIKQWNRGIANQLGLDEQDAQAVMWYFEQQLYYGLGVKSARSEAFSDGARSFVNDRGISESVRGSDAPEAAAEPTGSAAAGQSTVREAATASPTADVGQGPEEGPVQITIRNDSSEVQQ